MQYLDFAGIAGVILAVVALYKAWKGEPKDTADAAKVWQEMSAAAAIQQQDCRQRMDEIEKQLDCLQDELKEYKDGVDILIKQLEERGVTPKWRPRRRNG